MTQIDSAPLAQAKPATSALRDRGARGPDGGDAGNAGDRPRFGDHWRSMLSGGETGGDPAGDPDDAESAAANSRSPRFDALLRLPPDVFARVEDSAGEASDHGIDSARPGEGPAIVDALDASKNAAPATRGNLAGDPDAARPETATIGKVSAPTPGLQAAGDRVTGERLLGEAEGGRSNAAPAAQAVPARDAGAPFGRGSAETAGSRDLHLAIRADAAQPSLKATVIREATHFAPALGATNVQAISSALAEAAGEMREAATRSAPDPAGRQPGFRPGGPVKMLTIQLTPVSLGRVNIEMRIADGAMKVDIRVADPKALEMVRADKDLIMSLVRKAGVVPETVTIQTAENASAAKQNQTGNGPTDGRGFERGAAHDGGARSGPHRADTQEGGSSDEGRKTGDTRLRGDIYL